MYWIFYFCIQTVYWNYFRGEKITGYKDEHFDSIKEKLEMRIEEEGRYINGYNKDFYITASYTDPTDQSNAYSEVWFVANEQQWYFIVNKLSNML